MPTLEWRAERQGESALLVIGGLFPIRLRAEGNRWTIEGGDGRKREGPAPSLADAKKLCLRAVATALTAGTMDVTRLLLAPPED